MRDNRENTTAIIGRADDPHVQMLQEASAPFGPVSVLSLGLPPESYSLRKGTGHMLPSVEVDGEVFSPLGAAKTTVWYLPFAMNDPPPVDASSEFSAREWRALLESLIAHWYWQNPSGWPIRPDALQLQDRKIHLLEVIAEAGIAIVPETEIGKRIPPDLAKRGGLVAKPLGRWHEIDKVHYFNTTRLEPGVLAATAGADMETPIFVQREFPHTREFRTYIAGARSVTVALDRRVGATEVDFRLLVRNGDISARPLDDNPLHAALARAVSDTLNLGYCALDYILRESDGAPVVFDVNPCGSWAYIERAFGIGISKRLVDGVWS